MIGPAAAAWIPVGASYDILSTLPRGIEWIASQRPTRAGGKPVVLFPLKREAIDVRDKLRSSLASWCEWEGGKSPRSGDGRVIAVGPTAREMLQALRWAGNGALIVVDHPAWPSFEGWGREVGALDLTSGRVLDPISTVARSTLDSVLQLGRDGWTRQGRHGRPATRPTAIGLLRALQQPDRAEAARVASGYAVAAVGRGAAVDGLAALIQEAIPEALLGGAR